MNSFSATKNSIENHNNEKQAMEIKMCNQQ